MVETRCNMVFSIIGLLIIYVFGGGSPTVVLLGRSYFFCHFPAH